MIESGDVRGGVEGVGEMGGGGREEGDRGEVRGRRGVILFLLVGLQALQRLVSDEVSVGLRAEGRRVRHGERRKAAVRGNS